MVLLTYSTMKTFRMGGVLKEKTAYIKSFRRAKAKQSNDHKTSNLSEHQYDATVIPVGINDLLNIATGISTTQIVGDIIKIVQWRRNHNVGKIFVSGIVYSAKLKPDLIQTFNKENIQNMPRSTISDKLICRKKKIKQNWTRLENFDSCFSINFGRHCQKLFFRSGDQALACVSTPF